MALGDSDLVIGPITIPAVLISLALNVLNYAMFLGGVVVKLPQIIAILRTRTVKGFSEVSLATEFLACLSLCAYNMLVGNPFKTWGEMSLIAIQCAVQIALFWTLSSEQLSMAPRVTGTLAVASTCVFLWMGLLPAALLPALGLMPTVLGAAARVPQIILNHRQKHTGNNSVITWGMSLAGNVIRVITTLAAVNDLISLVGHVSALVLNLTLVLQILAYWFRTNEVVWAQKKDEKKRK